MDFVRMDTDDSGLEAIISSPAGIVTTFLPPHSSHTTSRTSVPPPRARIESLPFDILLLFADLLEFETVTALLRVSTTFRSLARRVLLTKHGIWYRKTRRDRFYDVCLDDAESDGIRGPYMRGEWCLVSGGDAGYKDNCPCIRCCECKAVQWGVRVHRITEELCVSRPWESSKEEFEIRVGSYVPFLLPDGYERLMGQPLFEPPVTEEVKIRLSYKFYYPEVEMPQAASPWGEYAPMWSYNYEVREAGVMISPADGEEYISVRQFCRLLEGYIGTMFVWEESLEITGIGFHQEYHAGTPNIDVMLHVRPTYFKEEYWNHEKQEYNVPFDLQEFSALEEAYEYSDDEDPEVSIVNELREELEDLKSEKDDWEKVWKEVYKEDDEKWEDKAWGGSDEVGRHTLKLSWLTQRTRGL